MATVFVFTFNKKLQLRMFKYVHKVYQYKSLYDCKVSYANVMPIQKIHVSTMLLLLIVGNEKCDGGVAFSDILYVRLMKVW